MNFRNDMGPIKDPLGVPRTEEDYIWAIETGYIIPAFRDGIITVDKLLDHADVVLDWLVPSVDAMDFMNFIRLSLGEEPENTNPKAHYFMIDCIFKQDTVKPYFDVRNIDYDFLNDRVLVLCTREFAKSVLLGSYLVLYMAAKGKLPGFGPVNYMLYVSDSMRNNVKSTMETIGSVYRESEYLRSLFESARTVQDEINFVRNPITKKEIALYNEYVNKRGLKPEEVPGRMKRTFSMGGLGASALPLGTKLYSDTNKNITIGNCKIGDKIFGADGKETIITQKSKIFNRPVYRILLADGRSLDVCEEHINSVKIKTRMGQGIYKSKNILTKDLLLEKLRYKKVTQKRTKYERRVYIENINPINYSEQELKIDPYTLGCLLADGSFKKEKRMAIFHKNKKDFDEMKNYIHHDIGNIYVDKRTGIYSINIKGIYSIIDEYGLSGITVYDKYIPKVYTYSSIRQREDIVRGMMDCDGTIYKNGRTLYCTSSKTLAYQFLSLVRTLGCKSSITISKPNNKRNNLVNSYKIEFISKFNPFKLLRKSSRFKIERFINKVAIISVEKIDQVPTQCIGVDNVEHQFIAGNFVRTHNTGGRGSRQNLDRPNGVFFDDLLGSEADANSDIILENVESTIESDILPAMSGNGSFALMAGTPYNKNDPAYKRIEDGSWLPIVFPKAERMDETITESNFRGVWADRHSYKKCKSDWKKANIAKEKGNPVPMRKLNQEYYLRISNDADRMVPESLLEWFDRDDIANNSWKYNWYITTDYTTTGSQGSDLSGAALWAVDWNGNFYLMDLTLRKMELEAQYRETFAMVSQTVGNTRGVEAGVETDGQQSLHIVALKDRMPKNNVYFTFARQKGQPMNSEGIRSRLEGGNKHWRFRLMLPMFQNRKIKFAKELKYSSDMNELLEEIKYCTYSGFNSKYDDGLDLLSMIGAMEVLFPAKNIEAPKKGVGMKKTRANAKVWGKQIDDDNESTAYDSYNG